MRDLTILNIAKKKRNDGVLNPVFLKALSKLGSFQCVENGLALSERQRAELIRNCDVLLTFWGSCPVPASIARNPGRLRYICNFSGSVKEYVPLEVVAAGIPLTNWGDAAADDLAEGAVALLFAVTKGMHHRIRVVRAGGWAPDRRKAAGSLQRLNVGVYGCGMIGRRFIEMLRPFGCIIRVFDPYLQRAPQGCVRAATLRELFATSQAVAIHAGLTKETEHSVNAELLALLPDRGMIVNTARGAIVDQDALFAELRSGRLSAGLDVLEPDELPSDHPARTWENCILTSHSIGDAWVNDSAKPTLDKKHLVCLANLRRFANGRPLKFLIDRARYLRST